MVLTAETFAENPTLTAPAGTITEAGTATAALLLLSPTVVPPLGAAALRFTAHASVPAPVMDELVHEIALGTGVPIPLRATMAEGLVEEVLLMVSWPVAAPLRPGLNWTVSVEVCPGLRLMGNALPERENPAPVTLAEFRVTATVPVEERISDCVLDELTVTPPKLMLEAFTDSVGTAAFNCSATFLEAPPAVAVSVAVCDVVTAEMVAKKTLEVTPLGTVTEAGTPTALLLLDRLTVIPALGAAAVSVAVHELLPAPMKVLWLQESD